jgi:type 1 glutamine amidotransferase
MVVTGGHAYDTSFDSLFEGHSDVAAAVYPRNIAFRADLRQKWDVLAFYDLTPEITEAEQQRLREFLESGKGLVILHHAIADYNGWRWWYEDVVGGKYFLKPEGDRPASTYRQGTEVVYTPLPHPVTAGIEPLRMVEETYKGMWLSPKSKPILQSVHPASDPVVAWIGPYEKSRVVAIQPGHDRKAHTHPGYRALVRNAILWAAGKKE